MWCTAVGFIITLTLSLLAVPRTAAAQRAAHLPRIGVLAAVEPSIDHPNIAAFRHVLHDLGYVEEQTIAMEWRFAHGRVDRFPTLIAELVGLKVDVLVIESGQAAAVAKQATQTIPIVFVGAPDPVGRGLVASVARPGGNLTGAAFAFGEGLSGKWVELLKMTAPGITRVAVLRDPTSPISVPHGHEIQSAAQALGLTLQPFEVRDPHQFDRAFAAMVTEGAHALIVDASLFFYTYRGRIIDFAAQHRLPAIYFERGFVDAGGLMSYGARLADFWRRAAVYVDKILKGAKPADLPVEWPMRIELVINRKTAQALGLTVPPMVLIQADEVLK